MTSVFDRELADTLEAQALRRRLPTPRMREQRLRQRIDDLLADRAHLRAQLKGKTSRAAGQLMPRRCVYCGHAYTGRLVACASHDDLLDLDTERIGGPA